jgi:PhzF family phenazine biosynthesis protein
VTVRRFIQCDVFSPEPARGNALAVVIDGDGLDVDTMQRFAAWTNLAETTFILLPTDPQADYCLKIFSPTREMLFAGHPTLGSCAAWLQGGGKPRHSTTVIQQCGVGNVEIDIGQPNLLAFTAPPTKIRPIDPRNLTSISKRLNIDSNLVVNTAELENGPVWQLIELANAEAILALDSSKVRWPEFKAIGVIGKQNDIPGIDYEVRMLAPSSGMSEDPITGSLNSAIAHWLQSQGRLSNDLVIAQGTNIGRKGRVYIRPQSDGSVQIGGHTHVLIEGRLEL